MRTDVKLGIVLATVVIAIAGWYYTSDRDGDVTLDTPSGNDVKSATAAEKPDEGAKPAKKKEVPGDAFVYDTSKKNKPAASSRKRRPNGAGRRQKTGNRQPGGAEEKLAKKPQSAETPARGSVTEDAPIAPETDAMAGLFGPPSMNVAPVDTPVDKTLPGGLMSPGADTVAKPKEKKPKRARTHTVQKGDTLTAIAYAYYGTAKHVKTVLAANPKLKDPNRLRVGDKISIPEVPDLLPAVVPTIVQPAALARTRATTPRRPSQTASSSTGTYVVREKDTFYSIAKNVLGSANRWKEIFELNKHLIQDDPRKLRAGLVLKLPTT